MPRLTGDLDIFLGHAGDISLHLKAVVALLLQHGSKGERRQEQASGGFVQKVVEQSIINRTLSTESYS